MRKVFKPENIVKNSRTVRIPDIEFKPEPVESEDEANEQKILTDEVYEQIKTEMREELAGELGRKKLSAAHERDVMLGKAKRESQQVLDDANSSRRQILDETNAAAELIKKNAYDEGLKKGISDKTELLENLSHYISQSIEQLKHDEDEYFEEYGRQLKYVACEIAEKIIYQKIQDDDMTMYNLVKNAVKTVRDAPWIKAEVSEKLSGYVDSLEKEFADSGINAEISISENVPDDTCRINTSDGFVVASVSQQLENIKEFISRQDKGGNDEEVS